MNPREADPTGANSGGGGAGLEGDVPEARPANPAESVTPGVDAAERQTITSGIAQTSEIADRDAQEDAEGQGDGTPQPR